MVREAEIHAEEDRCFHELVSARNQAEALVHAARKTLEEVGTQLDAGEKAAVETAINNLEAVMSGDDKAEIEARSKELSDKSAGLAEKLYAQKGGAAAATGQTGPAEDGVIDAEFEDISKDSGRHDAA